MPRKLTLVIVALLIAGAGFAAGLLTQRSFLTQSGASDTTSPPLRKDLDELLTAWAYPGAKLKNSARGGKLIYSVSTASDDMNKVGKHYANLVEQPVSAEGSSGGVAGGDEAMVASGSDSLTPDDKPRGVQAAVASRWTRDYVVTVHLSRSKDEDATHIVLTFAQR
jgi:hypothetical protein